MRRSRWHRRPAVARDARQRNLKPELHAETEIGGDLELWNRYALNVTYAHANIKNQILPVPVPPRPASSGSGGTPARLTNKTLEFAQRSADATPRVPVVDARDL